jgi:hypothetical protein
MNIFFAYPVMLWGLVAGAIPLLIHLLRRRQARRRVLPTFRFLSESHKQRLLNIRFQDLLLLILRTLLILLLVIALAGPKAVIGGAAAGWLGWLSPAGARRVILVDASRSMKYEQPGGTRFEIAAETARRLIEQLPVATEILVAGFSRGGAEEQRAFPASFSRDRSDAMRQLDLLQPADHPTRVSRALERAAERLQSAPDGGIFLLTDVQRSGWEDILASPEWGQEFGLPLSVIDVGSGRNSNIWIDRVSLPALPPGPGEQTEVRVSVAAEGFSGDAHLPVRLTLLSTDEREKSAREILAIPGDSVEVALPFSPGDGPVFEGILSAEPKEWEDPLPEDNRVEFSCPVLSPVKVRILMQGNKKRPEEEAFLRASLQYALEVSDSTGQDSFFQLEFMEPGGSLSFEEDSPPVTIIYGRGGLPAGKAALLSRQVREGAALLVFADADWPERSRTDEMLPWLNSLGISPGEARYFDSGIQLELTRPEHSLAADMGRYAESLYASVKAWSVVPVNTSEEYILAELTLRELEGSLERIPALAAAEVDSGRLMVCGLSLRKESSTMATCPAWVPFMQQAVKYLASEENRIPQAPEVHPEEGDLSTLSAADKSTLEEQMPITFAGGGQLAESIAGGRGSHDLSAFFLMAAVVLGLVEVFVGNRMK